MQGRGDKFETLERAIARRATPRVQAILKAAVSAGSTAIGSDAAIAEWPSLVAAFVQSLSEFSAYDAMFPSMRVVPLRSRVSVVTQGVSGATVGETEITPISNLQVAANALSIYKALAILIATDELLKINDPAVPALFAAELKNGVAIETDRKFIPLITSGISPITSSGATAANVLFDIDAAAATLSIDNSSKLFLIVSSAVALKWSLRTTADGALAFPQMTPTGGSIGGITVVTSGGLAANTFVLVDAHQVAAATGNIELSASNQAALEFQSAPSSPPVAAQLIQSLWQQNETGLRTLRYFSAQRLRDTAVAVVGSLNYTGNSPA
jgi:hypothetical protein